MLKKIRNFFNRKAEIEKRYNVKNEDLFKYNLPVYTR